MHTKAAAQIDSGGNQSNSTAARNQGIGGSIVTRNIVLPARRQLATCAALLLSAASALAAAPSRPNIMLIIGDDIGVDAVSDMYPGMIDSLLKQYGPSGHNHPKYQEIKGRPASTPSLNALSKAGMRFTQAWVQPFCANTRASIITGLYPARMGVIDYNGWLDQKHHSFVRDLKDKGGYATAVFGKYHIAGLNVYPGMKAKEAGFEIYRGNMTGAVATYWEWDYHVQDETSPADQFRTEKAPTRSMPGVAPTSYAPVVTAADTLEWIKSEEKKNPSKPWFAWVAFNTSHISANQRPSPMAVPNLDTLDEPSRKEMESCGGTFGTSTVGQCTDKQLMRAMTNSMDTLIGKLLKEIEGIDPNTYVIYMGDNGTWMMGTGRDFIDNMYITRVGRSKGTAYESGARVEMVIRGPNVKAGSVSDVPIDGVDLFSTILTLARLDVPKTVPDKSGKLVALDGVSITPVLFNAAKSVRDPDRGYLLAETMNPVKQNMLHVGARNLKYKVVCAENAQTGSCEFYNLVNDPLEEYQLTKPESCAKYVSGEWKTSAPEWNFCKLQEVLAKESILAEFPRGGK
jgi:arylsulfatase A-like enzyme